MQDVLILTKNNPLPDNPVSEDEYCVFTADPSVIDDTMIDSIKRVLDSGTDIAVIANCQSVLSAFDRLIYKIACGENTASPIAVGFKADKLASLVKDGKGNVYSVLIESVYSGMKRRHIDCDKKFSRSPAGLIGEYFSIFMASHALKYLFSSVAAFIIDYVLLLILSSVIPVASLEIGALIAWCVSSLTNFFINRSFVFRSAAPIPKALAEYYSLAAVVFVLKTYVLLELMTRLIGIPLGIAKPIAEVVFYVCNYFVQKRLIFKRR